MNKYTIEHKIETLARNAVFENHQAPSPSFNIEGIKFVHGEFNIQGGWTEDSWIASEIMSAKNLNDAINSFRSKLANIVPKAALVIQCYIDFITQPFLVTKEGSEVGFFRYTVSRKAVGLMFMESELKALGILLNEASIPKEFYYYWNDTTNTYGYTSKLLVMFSALEALVKIPNGKDWNKLEEILGKDLKEALWGTKLNSETGLRHRLIHGEYFDPTDYGHDYLDLVHKRVVSYFNSKIFKEGLISESVVHPQRHFFGVREAANMYLKPKLGHQLTLKDILHDFDENDLHNLANYEDIYDPELQKNF